MNRFFTVATSLALVVCCFSSEANATEVGPQYGFQSLGLAPNGFGWRANAISDVGVGNELVIVGGDGSNISGTPIRWTETNGAQNLFAVQFGGIANDVSADGGVIVGVDLEAFRWTEADGVQYLGVLPGGGNFSQAHAVTRDGAVTVGSSNAGLTSVGSRIDEAFSVVDGGSIQPLETFESILGDFSINGWGALDAVTDQSGNLWSVGGSALSGGASAGIVWKNQEAASVWDEFGSYEPDAFQGATFIPAVGINNDTLIVPVNRSTGGFAGNVGFEVFTADVSGETVTMQSGGIAQEIPIPILAAGYKANDISSEGSVIVGSAVIFGEDNGTVGGLSGVRNEPHVWEQQGRIWGSSSSSTPSLPQNTGEFRYVNLYELLQENLPATQQSSLMFDDWALNEAVGVTVGEVEAPLLGVAVLTSVVVGNGIDPSGQSVPWTATVRHAPGLEVESLTQRDLFHGGDFTGDGSEWTESGDGTFEVINNPVGEGTVGRLTTDTEFSISQLVETPDSPFVIAFDMLFTTDVGSFQIALDGILLEEIFAPTTLESELVTVPILVADPALLGRTDVPLSLTAFGGSTGQVLIDNVAIASIAVPEPSTLGLFLLGVVAALSRRAKPTCCIAA